LGVDCSKLKASTLETKAENESLLREKHIAESRLEELAKELDGLKVEKELVNSLNEELGTAAEEKERLASKHLKCLDELKVARSSVMELEKGLESTKSILNDNSLELQKEKDSAASQIKQLEASLKNLESELEPLLKKILDMQKINEDLELANSNLHNEIIVVQGEKNEAVAFIVNLESDLEQQSEEKNAAIA
jgi:chromosome segregation ATPase